MSERIYLNFFLHIEYLLKAISQKRQIKEIISQNLPSSEKLLLFHDLKQKWDEFNPNLDNYYYQKIGKEDIIKYEEMINTVNNAIRKHSENLDQLEEILKDSSEETLKLQRISQLFTSKNLAN